MHSEEFIKSHLVRVHRWFFLKGKYLGLVHAEIPKWICMHSWVSVWSMTSDREIKKIFISTSYTRQFTSRHSDFNNFSSSLYNLNKIISVSLPITLPSDSDHPSFHHSAMNEALRREGSWAFMKNLIINWDRCWRIYAKVIIKLFNLRCKITYWATSRSMFMVSRDSEDFFYISRITPNDDATKWK